MWRRGRFPMSAEALQDTMPLWRVRDRQLGDKGEPMEKPRLFVG